MISIIIIIIMKTPYSGSAAPYNTVSMVVYKTNSRIVLKTNRIFGLDVTEEMCLEFLVEAGAR